MPRNDVDQNRLECEAREWLRRGYNTNATADGLMRQIAAQRGKAAAEKLRAEMLKQWARRAEWLSK